MHVIRNAHIRGFSLVEVLVALTVVSIGMLGIAKIHSLAYANTTTANLRSLAALQGSSLAAAMHANRTYWAFGSAPNNIDIVTTPGTSGTTTITPSPSDPTLATFPACNNPTLGCTSAQIAAHDLQTWAKSMRDMLPGAGATIDCPSVPKPVTCSIKVTYYEKWVTLDSKTVQSSSLNQQKMTYQMFVQP